MFRLLQSLLNVVTSSIMVEETAKGFLDLPRELRDMIYTLLLPEDRVMHFPPQDVEETILAVCDTCPRIAYELKSMVYKTCGTKINIIPDKAVGLPSGLAWDEFQNISMYIDHYEDDDLRDSTWPGVKEVVSRLRYGGRKFLPDLSIVFRDDF